MQVTELSCTECDTKISGSFPLPALLRLNPEDQKFILDFIKSSGSLKVMARQLELSYPTVRNMLDRIIDSLEKLEAQND